MVNDPIIKSVRHWLSIAHLGRATSATCAAGLGMPLNTLQQRLRTAGTTYMHMLQRERARRLRRYVASTTRPRTAQAARIIGVKNDKSFSAWYSNQFGESWREAVRRGAVGVL